MENDTEALEHAIVELVQKVPTLRRPGPENWYDDALEVLWALAQLVARNG